MHRAHLITLLLLVCSLNACSSLPRVPATAELDSTQRAKLQAPVTPDDFDAATLQLACFHATNQARSLVKRSKLAYHPKLAQASQIYAERMANKKFVEHLDPTSSSLRTPNDRAQNVGVRNAKMAENLSKSTSLDYQSGERVFLRGARGQLARTPDGPLIPTLTHEELGQRLVQQWIESPGHRKNLLSRDAVELGCGVTVVWEGQFPVVYAVQKFQLYEPVQD